MLRALRSRRVAKLPDQVKLQGRILFLAEDAGLVRQQLEGQDLDWRPSIKLRDNISTDEITPAYICYYYDETLGDFPYLGLKCGVASRSRSTHSPPARARSPAASSSTAACSTSTSPGSREKSRSRRPRPSRVP